MRTNLVTLTVSNALHRAADGWEETASLPDWVVEDAKFFTPLYIAMSCGALSLLSDNASRLGVRRGLTMRQLTSVS